MLRLAANLSLMFTEHPLLDRFDAARDAGFDRVELQFPYVTSADRLARARDAAGVEVVLINAAFSTVEHPAGIAGRPECVAAFAEGLEQTADYAEALGVRWVNVLAGTIAPGEDRGRALDTLAANLEKARVRLDGVGARPLFEVLNPLDAPGYLASDFETAGGVLDKVPGVGLQFDVYHAARIGLDPVAALAEVYPRVRHVQFADYPGRGAPGTGELDFLAILDWLQARAYPGVIAAEYRPAADTPGSLGWLQDWRDRYDLHGDAP